MLKPLRFLIAFPAFFLTLYGIMPVAVSAWYGGNPPPHIAGLLDKQMDTWSWVARAWLGPFSVPTAAHDKLASKE